MFTENTSTKCINSKLTKENSVSKNILKEQGAQKNTAIQEDTEQCVEWYQILKECEILKREYMCVGGGKEG